MCGKRSKALFLVLALALVSVQLSAWPTWLGGSGAASLQVEQLEERLLESEQEVQRLTQLIYSLEEDSKVLLSESEGLWKLNEELKTALTKAKESLTKAQSESRALESELSALKASSTIAEAATSAALEPVSAFGGMVGVSGLYDPDGSFSAELSAGVSYYDIMIVAGVIHPIAWPLNIGDLTYKLGIQYRF